MPRQTARTVLGKRRPPHASRLLVALAVLALCLRLVWPVPPPATPSTDAAALAALIGEHALCLAQPASAAQAPNSGEGMPAPGGGHPDHDPSQCCQWHSVVGFLVLQAAIVAQIAFVEIAPPIAAPSEFPPANPIGPNRARGPPARV